MNNFCVGWEYVVVYFNEYRVGNGGIVVVVFVNEGVEGGIFWYNCDVVFGVGSVIVVGLGEGFFVVVVYSLSNDVGRVVWVDKEVFG